MSSKEAICQVANRQLLQNNTSTHRFNVMVHFAHDGVGSECENHGRVQSCWRAHVSGHP
jgi:hypothetical protein